MNTFKSRLHPGDKVAVLSPSFAAPGMFPTVYELGLERLRTIFQLEPVEYPTTRKLGASPAERAADLVGAFSNPDIKAVIATIGGDDQVTYIKNLPKDPFLHNPKSFFGYSDNSHFCNFLFLLGIPSYYGGSIMTQYAMQGAMDEYTVRYIKHALFEGGEIEIIPSETYNDQEYDWHDDALLCKARHHWPNEDYYWDGSQNAEGILWGGCLESVDEMLRHDVPIPTLEQFKDIVLMLETSEEIPTADYVRRVFRAFGERGILGVVRGVLMGRAKAWELDKRYADKEKEQYRNEQRETVLRVIRQYNPDVTIVQNVNFGHTDPQVPMPYGGKIHIDTDQKKLFALF